MRWLHMFDTMCSRYRCRQVEDILPQIDGDLYTDGPGGTWLAEIVSVEFTGNGGLTQGSYEALRAIGQHVIGAWSGSADGKTVTVALNWFTHDARTGNLCCDERRQCLVNVCRNYQMVTVMRMGHTTELGIMSSNGLAFLRYPDRLRPFIFVLTCELFYRRVDFEVLNMHYEPLESSTRWRTRQTEWWYAQYGISVAFRPNGSGDGWLELARDIHSPARWLRVQTTVNKYHPTDPMITIRSPSGCIRFMWCDSRSVRTPGVCPVANGTLINFRDIDLELTRSRSCVLSLCDYDVLYKQCGFFLKYQNNLSHLLLPSPLDTVCNESFGVVDDDDDDGESSWLDRTIRRVRVSRDAESLRERHYFVDHTGTLASSELHVFS